MRRSLRACLVLTTLWSTQCVSHSDVSSTENGSSAGVRRPSDHRSAQRASPNPAVDPGTRAGSSGEIDFEEFKGSSLRKLERVGIVNLLRPYRGMRVAIKLLLEREAPNEYSIKSGKASITSPEDTTAVEVRGRLSLATSVAGNRILGNVESVDLEIVLGGATIARKQLVGGFEGRCPLELIRRGDEYVGFVSLVMPLEVGDVDFTTAFALPCELSSNKDQLVIGRDGEVDPEDLYLWEPPKPSGGLLLGTDLILGTANELRIVQGPHNAHFVLYCADQLADKLVEYDGCSDWWLDTSRQSVVTDGSLDSEGEARIGIDVSGDEGLVGSLRAYQAIVETQGGVVSAGPAVLKIVKR